MHLESIVLVLDIGLAHYSRSCHLVRNIFQISPGRIVLLLVLDIGIFQISRCSVHPGNIVRRLDFDWAHCTRSCHLAKNIFQILRYSVHLGSIGRWLDIGWGHCKRSWRLVRNTCQISRYLENPGSIEGCLSIGWVNCTQSNHLANYIVQISGYSVHPGNIEGCLSIGGVNCSRSLVRCTGHCAVCSTGADFLVRGSMRIVAAGPMFVELMQRRVCWMDFDLE